MPTSARAGAGGVLGYASSSPPGSTSSRGAYTHANATESTIWGGGGSEYDEKGFYTMGHDNEFVGNKKEIMGMEDQGSFIDHQNLDKRGSSGMKRNIAAGAGASKGNRKKWWIIGGIIVLGEA